MSREGNGMNNDTEVQGSRNILYFTKPRLGVDLTIKLVFFTICSKRMCAFRF